MYLHFLEQRTTFNQTQTTKTTLHLRDQQYGYSILNLLKYYY